MKKKKWNKERKNVIKKYINRFVIFIFKLQNNYFIIFLILLPFLKLLFIIEIYYCSMSIMVIIGLFLYIRKFKDIIKEINGWFILDTILVIIITGLLSYLVKSPFDINKIECLLIRSTLPFFVINSFKVLWEFNPFKQQEFNLINFKMAIKKHFTIQRFFVSFVWSIIFGLIIINIDYIQYIFSSLPPEILLVYELSVVVLGIVLTFIVGHLGDIIKEFKGLFKFFLIDPKLKILKILIEYLPRLKLLIDKKGIKYIMNIEDDNLDSDPKGLDRPTYDKSIISLNGSLGSTSLNQLENLAKDYIGILQCYQVLFANWFPQSAHTNISSLITDDEKKIFDSQIKKYKVDLILTSQGYQDYCNKYSIPVNPDLIQNPKNMIWINMSGNAQVIDRHITRLDFMRTFYNAQNDLNEVLRNIAIAIFNQNKGVEMYQIIEDLKNQYGEYLVIINAKNKLAFELDCYKIPKKYITDKKFEEECSNIQTIKKTLALNLRHNDDKGLLLKLIDCKRVSIYNDYSPKVLITISEVDEVKEKLDNSKDKDKGLIFIDDLIDVRDTWLFDKIMENNRKTLLLDWNTTTEEDIAKDIETRKNQILKSEIYNKNKYLNFFNSIAQRNQTSPSNNGILSSTSEIITSSSNNNTEASLNSLNRENISKSPVLGNYSSINNQPSWFMTPQEIAINQTGILEGESSKTGEKRKRSIGPDIESVNHQSKRYRTITPRNNE